MEESTKAFDIDLLAIVERKKGPSINDVTIFFSFSPGLIVLKEKKLDRFDWFVWFLVMKNGFENQNLAVFGYSVDKVEKI